MISTTKGKQLLCALPKFHARQSHTKPALHPVQARRFTKTCSFAYPATHSTTAPTTSDTEFDALVVGAGAGGVTAASLLANKGYRTLLVEAKDCIGGRASTRLVDGFLVNTGALVIELDGAVAKTYKDVGLSLRLYEPSRASTVLRFGGRDINITDSLVGAIRNITPTVFASISRVLPWLRPKKGESTRSWLNNFTRSQTIHGVVNNILGAMFAVRADHMPSEVFLHYFLKDTSFKKIGMPPGGTIEVWKPLADYVNKTGGQVWLNSTVSKLIFGSDGLVAGALVQRADGSEIQISSKVTVSNVGPLETVRLASPTNFPAGYAEMIERWADPAAIITVHFASQTPLAMFPCLAIFGKSRRMVYAGNFSAPELQRAPEGWHLYCGASVPIPSQGDFDVEKEKALLLEDLHDHFPGFDKAKIVAIDVTANSWPAQRAVSGFDQPQTTPVANLFNVGDGVKPWASGGTAACSQSARIVVEKIVEIFPLSRE
ncbi:hypothetical protein G7Z17_g3190 [Cylindrodendrum hubeiense]|uniref:Amine oxidase domain-containing protein n=1 Tax=Cylindrodendrum hubeiense TaxID=595255 RepID=A0A9P5HIG9_9HYPO|nr:hypothetical protein G7Z17_g3190 [Cylindrodendrum hubeiense]